MKYLCLIYDEEAKFGTMSKADGDALMQDYFTFTKEIRASGHYLGGNDLQPTRSATTIRVRNGRLSTTDGPFAEAKDLNEAVQIAARIPSAKRGSIEVRPIQEHQS
jgi:hypothetical protein